MVDIRSKIASITSINSKLIYSTIVQKKATCPEIACYLSTYLENQDIDCENIYILPDRIKIDMKIWEFYYIFTLNRLATRQWLYKVGLDVSNACSFCNGEAETVEHLFFNCEMVQKFWKEYVEWWSMSSGKFLNLTIENVLLGIDLVKLPVVENLCLLYAK